MLLQEELRQDLLSARKEKNEIKSDILRVIISEIESFNYKSGISIDDNSTLSIIKQMVKNNELSLKHSCLADVTDKLTKENEYLLVYIPKNLSKEEIKGLISLELIEEIKSSSDKDVGKLTGKIMQVIKSNGKSANGNDVKEVITDLRN